MPSGCLQSVRALARLLGRRHHEACTAPFRRFRGPIIVPAPIVTEVAYERRSAAVTSNIHSSRFDSTMPKTLATATVDNQSAAPRPPDPDHGRLAPPRRGPCRQGGDPAGHLTPAPPGEHAATSLENWWPPARRNQGHPIDFLMTVDSGRENEQLLVFGRSGCYKKNEP